jgi:outer membrane usher protein FimD/PapC
LDFGVEKTRRLLVRAHTTEGRAVPAGASVTDENDEWIGMVQGNGEIFIPNALATPHLWVSGPDLPRCELHIEPGERAEQDGYFESAVAVCHRVEDGHR